MRSTLLPVGTHLISDPLLPGPVISVIAHFFNIYSSAIFKQLFNEFLKLLFRVKKLIILDTK
jgi:hypothetical protein